jgi:hypothetical protein
MGEFLDVIGFFFGFWMFIFSSTFRKNFIKKWKEDGWGQKIMTVTFEVIPSIIFGLLPLWLYLFI